MRRDAVLTMRVGRVPEEGLDPEAQELLAAITDARNEYQRAINYFDSVSQPELVEHAVLLLAAAERHYSYLLGQARQARLRLPWNTPLDG